MDVFSRRGDASPTNAGPGSRQLYTRTRSVAARARLRRRVAARL